MSLWLSNHPKCITDNIPEAVNKRLSALSSNEQMFDSVCPIYQAALKNSGYTFQLKFNPTNITRQPKRNRARKIVWFNPPFSSSVKTNIGEKFLKIVDKNFTEDHPLKKIFNRNTLKVSYRCTPNIGSIISAHNTKILKQDGNPETADCNCGDLATCPLDQATVTQVGGPTETYIGATAPTFKTRLGNQTKLFRHLHYSKETKHSDKFGPWNAKTKITKQAGK